MTRAFQAFKISVFVSLSNVFRDQRTVPADRQGEIYFLFVGEWWGIKKGKQEKTFVFLWPFSYNSLFVHISFATKNKPTSNKWPAAVHVVFFFLRSVTYWKKEVQDNICVCKRSHARIGCKVCLASRPTSRLESEHQGWMHIKEKNLNLRRGERLRFHRPRWRERHSLSEDMPKCKA